MYSRRKGVSGSKRPAKRVNPSWVTYDIKTVEQVICKLNKAGKTTSEIGIVLRDNYGVPDTKALTKKTITAILKDNNMVSSIPEDLKALIIRDIAVMKHVEINKHDQPAKRGQILIESKIKRLAKYYKRTGKLPQDWKYEGAKAKSFVE